MWLVVQTTGPLADPIRRDLIVDGVDFDDLGWRGLWAYVTCAPPGTAIHQKLCEGWSVGDKHAAEQLYEARKLGWRYTAAHFVGGIDVPFPEPPDYPGATKPPQTLAAQSWQTVTVDQMVSPEVRALLQGA